MWNRKRVFSLILGVAVTSSSMMQGMPVYAANNDVTNEQIAEKMTEELPEETLEGLTEESTEDLA